MIKELSDIPERWKFAMNRPPEADARIIAHRTVDKPRPGSLRHRVGIVIGERTARREIIKLRVAQVGEVATAAGLRAGRDGSHFVAVEQIEVKFGFVASAAEPIRAVFVGNMMALAEQVAERLGQKEVYLFLGGHLLRASAPGEPPPKAWPRAGGVRE